MLSLRQILITAWIVLLLFVFLRHVPSAPVPNQETQVGNQVQVMYVSDRP